MSYTGSPSLMSLSVSISSSGTSYISLQYCQHVEQEDKAMHLPGEVFPHMESFLRSDAGGVTGVDVPFHPNGKLFIGLPIDRALYIKENPYLVPIVENRVKVGAFSPLQGT